MAHPTTAVTLTSTQPPGGNWNTYCIDSLFKHRLPGVDEVNQRARLFGDTQVAGRIPCYGLATLSLTKPIQSLTLEVLFDFRDPRVPPTARGKSLLAGLLLIPDPAPGRLVGG